MTKGGGIAAALLAAAVSAGCTSVSSNYTGAITRADAGRIYACSGFNCTYKTRIAVGPQAAERFAAIMAPGRAGPQAERRAIAAAVRHFEEMTVATVGVRDAPKSVLGQSGQKGQMDCIDESTNTRSLLRYLAARGLLRHHEVEANVSRGFFVDGRYPHATAVIRDPSGRRWAVDSWYEPAGGSPDIMPLDEWQARGVMGAR